MKVLLGDFTIFDHAWGDGSALFGRGGSVERAFDVKSPALASEITTFDLLTRQSESRFMVSRPCADAADALALMYRHDDDLPSAGVLRIEHGGTIVEITGQMRQLDMPRQQGSRVEFSYSFTGGRPRVSTIATPSIWWDTQWSGGEPGRAFDQAYWGGIACGETEADPIFHFSGGNVADRAA